MDIKFNCPQCRQPLEAPSDMGGEQTTCPKCNNIITIPRVAPSTLYPNPAPASVIIQNAVMISTIKTSNLAVASLVMGVLGVFGGWLCCGLIFPLLAIVFGHIAYSQINKHPNILSGKGMAIAGFILGYVGLFLSIIIGIAFGVGSAIMEEVSRNL